MRIFCAWALCTGLLAGCGGDDEPPTFEDVPGSPVVRLEAGKVRGAGTDILVFKGIPYAAAPTGDRRWRPPADAPAWTDATRDATAFGPACMQAANVAKSEDCLFVNVWAPRDAMATRKKLPVMVWVYGGSFHGGSGNIDGTPVAERGVVVVSMNYRVSTLGFMAHPELSAESPDKVSGNYGILDVAQSLKWVKANIERFGGDPQRVNIWGVSSGASVITALMVSPRSAGLFDRAILQSPGAFRHWKTLEQGQQQGVGVGASLAALRALPADQVPVIQNTGGGTAIRALSEPRVIGPVRDGVVLPNEERATFEAGGMAAVPVLVGNNTDEGSPFTGNYPISTVAEFRQYLQEPVIFGAFGAEAAGVYPVAADSEVKRGIALSFGDSQFWFGTRGVVRAATTKGLPSYRYVFSRKAAGGTGHDARHGEEVKYVFGDTSLGAAPYTADDVRISEAMMDAWVRFASTGNPNGGLITNWPAFDLTSEKAFVFDTMFSIVDAPRGNELDFIGRFDASLVPR
jgi:para-nitrobenzyl esterase